MTKKIEKELAETAKPKALTPTWESAIEKLTQAQLLRGLKTGNYPTKRKG